jgi:diguanylate cyclase (GGDEF)-like protein/hemerythrin-like metal-binding protein/PAS domain S-box-containing protein
MPVIYWSGYFELGIPEIDAQHARLVDLVNALAEALADAGRLPRAATLVAELEAYAAGHFRTEEALMPTSSLGTDVLSRHRREHRAFSDRLGHIRRNGALHRGEFAAEVLDFLTCWLVSHILGADRALARSLPGWSGTAHAAGPGIAAGRDPVEDDLLAVPPLAGVLIGALSETERRFRMLSDFAPVLIWVADAAGARGFYNRAWADLAGAGAVGAGFDHVSLVVEADRARYLAALADLTAARAAGEIEYRVGGRDGDIWLLERIRPRSTGVGDFAGMVAAATNVTAIKRSEAVLAESNRTLEAEVSRRTAELQALSVTDPLTGVGNRRRLVQALESELRRAARYERPLTALFVDLDRFKDVNDRFGHEAGDDVLVRVAATLRAGLRDVDVIGRWGGEEFVALLVETDLAEGGRVAERLREAVAALRFEVMPARTITVSVGVAEWRAGETGDALLRRADRALYTAKRDGRDRVRFAEREAAIAR